MAIMRPMPATPPKILEVLEELEDELGLFWVGFVGNDRVGGRGDLVAIDGLGRGLNDDLAMMPDRGDGGRSSV